jgi:hypothetical protein
MVQLTILGLLDSARAFHDTNPELYDKNITWPDFKAIFQKLFRGIRTDQYHITQLQTARQWTDEFIQVFADPCRKLAQQILPQGDEN